MQMIDFADVRSRWEGRGDSRDMSSFFGGVGGSGSGVVVVQVVVVVVVVIIILILRGKG